MHSNRLQRLRAKMEQSKLDALLVTQIQNVFYLSGFTGSTAAMVVTRDASHILVDPRYSIQARTECPTTTVHDYTAKSAIAAAAELANEIGPKTMGYEADQVTVTSLRSLRKVLADTVRLRATAGMIEGLRRVKDAHELELIREAVAISDRAYQAIVSEIRPGITEKGLALLIDTTMRRLGADCEAFETIAAAGPNSACPHWSPSDAVMQTGQFVKMDFGARYRKYNSDITRTVCLGEASSRQREVYQIVLDAQLKAIEAIAPGKKGKDIDAVAREYIASKGYGDKFGHGLGHGLGIDVHDGPGFSATGDVTLEPGMVITVEPGIYIEGWGGVRIEDDIVVTDTGVEILTKAPKDLICVR